MKLTLGSRIKRMRELRGLSLEQMARRSGVAKSLLITLEHDRGNPTVSTLERVAKALGVRFFPAFLVGEEDWKRFGINTQRRGQR